MKRRPRARRRTPCTRWAATVVAAAILVLVGGPPAAGQKTAPKAPPKPPGPEINSWALAPTGTDPGQPGTRAYLTYTVAPGATIKDSVTLWNYSNVQLTFQVYATDAFINATGAFDLLPGQKKPTDVGTWVKLPLENVTAKASSKVDMPFTLTVPQDARPGDHAGAVLAANQTQGTGRDGKVVTLDRRTGSRIYLRVRGPLQPALVVENVRTVYHPTLNPLGGSLDVTYTVRNAGNVRLAAHQRVSAKGPFGLAAKERKAADVPELLPDNSITLHEHFNSVPALIRASAEVRLEPFSPDPDVKSVPPLRRGGHTWALPWSVIVLLIALWLIRRSYQAIRRRRDERVVGPSPPPRDDLVRVP